jgi:hypothetical protein
MAFKLCCSCGVQLVTGILCRHCRVTATDLDDIGTELLAWALHSGKTQWWEITDTGSPMDRGDTALCYGVRYATYMPTTNGDQWNGLRISSSSLSYPLARRPAAYEPGFETDTAWPTNNPNQIDQASSHPEEMAFAPHFLSGSHLGGRIQSLITPHSVCNSTGTTANLNAIVRPRYYRVLGDGVDLTGIRDALIEDTAEKAYPGSIPAAGGWTNNAIAPITMDNQGDDTFYYSPNATASGVLRVTVNHTRTGAKWDKPLLGRNVLNTNTRSVTNFIAPLVFHDNKFSFRIAKSNGATIPGASDPGDALDLTVSLYRSTTLIRQETVAVPDDPTTFTFTLTESEAVALDVGKISQVAWPSLLSLNLSPELRFQTTASSGSAPRGCALINCNFEAPADWKTQQQSQIRNLPSEVNLFSKPIEWLLDDELSTWALRKNKVITLDVWYEVYKRETSSTDFYLMIGSDDSSVYGTSNAVSHGHIGFRVPALFEIGYEQGQFPQYTYRLTFNGGTFRPSNATGDVLELRDAIGDTNNVYPFAIFNQPDDDDVTILLYWYSEIPHLVIKPIPPADASWLPAFSSYKIIYVPENVTGIVTTVERQGTGDIYSYQQNGGGVWDGIGPTTFVPLPPPQHNSTGTFTDVTFGDAPTSITVERIPY